MIWRTILYQKSAVKFAHKTKFGCKVMMHIDMLKFKTDIIKLFGARNPKCHLINIDKCKDIHIGDINLRVR